MLIFSQDKMTIVNSNLVVSFEVSLVGDGMKNTVYANIVDGSPIELGCYITKNDALNVLSKIAETEGAINVFYMPMLEVEEWQKKMKK